MYVNGIGKVFAFFILAAVFVVVTIFISKLVRRTDHQRKN
jgi:Na+-transporting methylmalonyl-CoA/oxaloacetate decarboxylase gamma subunit